MIQRLHKNIRFVITIFVLFFSLWSYAGSPVRITILLSGESRLYYDAVDGITEKLDAVVGLEYELTTVRDLNDNSINEVNKNSDYIVVVGTKALQAIASKGTAVTTLNILVSKRSYQIISDKSQNTKNFSVIYLDQPADRTLLLTKLILRGNANKVAMLFGPTSVSEKEDYVRIAKRMSLQLIEKVITTDESSLDVIETLIKQSDAYVALYDRKVLNRKIAKWLLYMANVYRKPVIAYSKSYVEAGALAAVYTNPIDAGRSAAAWLLENIKNSRAVKWKRYPQRFTVDINRRISAKLNLMIDDSDIVSARIKAAEVKND